MNHKPVLALFISIISVSFAAILIKTCDKSTSALSISFYRLLFTTLLLIPFIIYSKKSRRDLVHIPKKSMILMIGIGFILALHFALWVTSLKLTSVASSVILVTAHPIMVAPLSFSLQRKTLPS